MRLVWVDGKRYVLVQEEEINRIRSSLRELISALENLIGTLEFLKFEEGRATYESERYYRLRGSLLLSERGDLLYHPRSFKRPRRIASREELSRALSIARAAGDVPRLSTRELTILLSRELSMSSWNVERLASAIRYLLTSSDLREPVKAILERLTVAEGAHRQADLGRG